ncbi:unnamed protein product [Rotaria magnacalcarata]|uniref:Uncharacterized protein n=3 Tax=Rotaria magnacalcarata TaxID=392030 RepID=A0A815J5T0_9BILA|nr:unnamed protein product [Rotaria magnacalcarata]CAF1603409.1 unnamed protein product [Rotaria magnacalcarata]CAF2122665.1 unnamed protein product [Rotaria magnacalcarata]CAF2212277.1 unnamed protein product [Rotaria magnacalcarata]CAF3884544.1 unnamed protein product [Rotaria magnacalcarata]
MQLETLANELFIEVFEYLDGIHILCAFGDLNTRFNTLLLVHFSPYQLDFRSVSKYDFDLICQRYLPLIDNRVIKICFSNDVETPFLYHHFVLHNLTLNQFAILQSLSLVHIGSLEKINRIINESSLCMIHLKYLTITNYFNENSVDFDCLINQIWLLPKLIRCTLNSPSIATQFSLSSLSTRSSSIEYFSTVNLQFFCDDMSHLFEYTPRLRYLRVTLGSDYEVESSPKVPVGLTALRLYARFSDVGLRCLLQNASHLLRLIVRTEDFYLNGHQWKHIIVNHLPNLQIVRFRMHFKFEENQNIQELIEALLNTFRTPFWLDDRGWFIQCQWKSQSVCDDIYFYTLPMIIDDLYALDSRTCYKSTCPNDLFFYSYDSIRNILPQPNVDDRQRLPIHCPLIKSIKITLPIHENIWSVFATLNHLTSLHLSNQESSTHIEHQLESLLNQTSSLYSLVVNEHLALRLSSLKITNRSIRRVNCFERCEYFCVFFNANECSKWIDSSLGHQCEVFCIKVENQDNVIDLVQKMPNLRALICECERDKLSKGDTISSDKDDFIERLKEDLPAKCIVNRDVRNYKRIQLWVDK